MIHRRLLYDDGFYYILSNILIELARGVGQPLNEVGELSSISFLIINKFRAME